jgi:hypothetical protein
MPSDTPTRGGAAWGRAYQQKQRGARRQPQGNAYGQQRAMQNTLAPKPAGPPMGMQSIAPPGGPMGPPPMGMGGGNPMQQLQTQRAAGVFDKPNMAPPMPQFQRPDMSGVMAQANAQRDAFRQGGVGLPPQGIGPPPGTAPGMPPPPGGGAFGGHTMPNMQPQLDAARQRMAAFQKPQMGSIQPPPWAGGGGPVADNQMGMQRRAAGLAGMQRPGMM